MYSIRMRASRENTHISGAERIVSETEIPAHAASLVERALGHERGKPDFINISIEEVKIPVKHLTSLPVKMLDVGNVEEGKKAAKKILRYLGIPVLCIEKAFSLLEKGPCDGECMRGAIVMDMQGNRNEPDKHRGIRATHMDMTEEASDELAAAISAKGLGPYFVRVKEALVLATKVTSVKGTVAELCWSDDPSYTVGYVASKKLGYVRIPHMKHKGDPNGGRVFFIDNIDLTGYINEIENCPYLINKFGGLKDIHDIHTITGE